MSTQEQPVEGVQIVLECLRRYREHQDSAILPRSESPRLQNGRQFMAGLDFSPRGIVDELFDNPARTILRLRVREVAWSAYAAGGMRELRRLFDAVEIADESAGDVLDKWLNGLGSDEGGRWAA